MRRIDRFASGILLLPRPIATAMSDLTVSGATPVRKYLAVVRGRQTQRQGRWSIIFAVKECISSCDGPRPRGARAAISVERVFADAACQLSW